MILKTVADLRAVARGWRAKGEVIGVVPTMGALHDGHLSLARRARAECDRVITTIFVNPKQFNNPEDLKKYPRTLEADAELLGTVPVDAIFAPPVEEVYPEGFITNVTMQGVAQPLEGYMRPGHFDGVATVVTKLFGLAAVAGRPPAGARPERAGRGGGLRDDPRGGRAGNVVAQRAADCGRAGEGSGPICRDHAGGGGYPDWARRPHGDPRGGRDDA
jgi:cytidyltransferase-like protein